MLDPEALAEITGQIVREHVAKSIVPLVEETARLRERVAVLEAREAPAPDADLIRQLVAEAVAALPPAEPGKDGKDFEPDMAEVERLLNAAVDRRFADLAPPKDGASVTIEDFRPLIDDAVAVAVAALPPGEPGEPGADADPATIARMVDEAVALVPSPKDGTSVTIEDVRPLIDDAVASAVAAMPAPKDGVGLAGALIDRDGALVVTLTDGTLRTLGQVVGRDYDPAILASAVADAVAEIPTPKDGEPGADADPAVIQRMVDEAVALIPPPKDGEPGKDGYGGTARGLWDANSGYRAMDVVSFNGSEWRAKRDDPGELPGDGWMLSASRGKRGEPGKPGSPGQAIVAGYVDPKALMIVLTRDDGEEIKIDFYDLARTIKDA